VGGTSSLNVAPPNTAPGWRPVASVASVLNC